MVLAATQELSCHCPLIEVSSGLWGLKMVARWAAKRTEALANNDESTVVVLYSTYYYATLNTQCIDRPSVILTLRGEGDWDLVTSMPFEW
jgi:hypothetical protein